MSKKTELNNTDGNTRKISVEILQGLKDELKNVDRYLEQIKSTRLNALKTRLAVWDGQSEDGRKHAVNNNDEDVKPFEGACDQRMRLADMLINDEVMLLVMAALSGQIQIQPMEGTDIEKATRLRILLRYILHNKLGWRWMKELIKAANYYLADSPALVWFDVRWSNEEYLTPQRMTTDELGKFYMASAASQAENEEDALELAQAAYQQFVNLMLTPQIGEDEIADFLVQLFPEDLTTSHAKKMVRELRKNGATEFAVIGSNQSVMVEGKRLWEDFYIPATTTEFQRAPAVFETSWLSRSEVEVRSKVEGWSKTFVAELLKQEGKKAMDNAFVDEDTRGISRDETSYAHLYQIVTALFISVNSKGIAGRYEVTFHPDIEDAATEMELLGTAEGRYPGHILQREVISKWLMDSRSLAELASADQSTIKLFLDGWGDNAQMSAIPPIITRGRRGQGNLYIGPLEELRAKRDGDYKWLSPPPYPASIVRVMQQIRNFNAEYFGRPLDDGSNEVQVTLARQFKVSWWLSQMAEIFKQMLQLTQQNMPDEEFARVLNTEGEPVIRDREEIAGMFDITIDYDVRDLSVDDYMKRAKAIKDLLLVMDREGVINTTPLVTSYLSRLEPTLAVSAIRTKEKAAQSELEDEMKKYQQALSGIEPEMVTDGSQDYALRLSFYEQLKTKNPIVFEGLAQDRQEILQARIEHLAAMSEQFGANSAIGRQGTSGALSAEAAGPVPGGTEG